MNSFFSLKRPRSPWMDLMVMLLTAFLSAAFMHGRISWEFFVIVLWVGGTYFLLIKQDLSPEGRVIKGFPSLIIILLALWSLFRHPGIHLINKFWDNMIQAFLGLYMFFVVIARIKYIIIGILSLFKKIEIRPSDIRTHPMDILTDLYASFTGWMLWVMAMIILGARRYIHNEPFRVFAPLHHVVFVLTVAFIFYYYFKAPVIKSRERSHYWLPLSSLFILAWMSLYLFT